MKQVTIRTYGAAKSNPGAAAIAVQIVDTSDKVLAETVETIGNATDVYAAFTAVARGLGMAEQEFGAKTTEMKFNFTLSNEEVKLQVNNESPINNPGVVPHFIEIHNMKVVSFPNLSFSFVPNEKNTEVSALVNEALDAA